MGRQRGLERTLEDMLRRYIDPQQENWDKLPFMECAVNNAWQESVQSTPFYLNYGQNPHTPLMATFESKVPAAEHFARGFHETITDAKQALKDAHSRQKNVKDKHRRELSFVMDDWVLLSTKNIKLKAAGTKKLMAKFIGPLKVKQQVGPVAYKLDMPEGTGRFHDVFLVQPAQNCTTRLARCSRRHPSPHRFT